MEMERNKNSGYDSSLNNSNYKEFWSEIKPNHNNTTRNSKSVAKRLKSEDRNQNQNINKP